jgi:hypothetical protein
MISRFAYLLCFRMCSHILLVPRAYDPPGSTVRISVIKIDYFVMAITSV